MLPGVQRFPRSSLQSRDYIISTRNLLLRAEDCTVGKHSLRINDKPPGEETATSWIKVDVDGWSVNMVHYCVVHCPAHVTRDTNLCPS